MEKLGGESSVEALVGWTAPFFLGGVEAEAEAETAFFTGTVETAGTSIAREGDRAAAGVTTRAPRCCGLFANIFGTDIFLVDGGFSAACGFFLSADPLPPRRSCNGFC
jgi:hypothetical protein